jgi:hypothetical protein
VNKEKLFEELKVALTRASRTNIGKLVLAGHNEDYELQIKGNKQPICVSIADGKMRVFNGPSKKQKEPLSRTRVQVDERTLRSLLAGEISPVEAMDSGKLFLRTRLYGGAQITILFRAAYDLAREKMLPPPKIRRNAEESGGYQKHG